MMHVPILSKGPGSLMGEEGSDHRGRPSVDLLDPIVEARVRYTVAPGHELFLRGDIGGSGVGSDFSWQAIGAYGFELGTYQGITFSGVIG